MDIEREAFQDLVEQIYLNVNEREEDALRRAMRYGHTCEDTIKSFRARVGIDIRREAGKLFDDLSDGEPRPAAI